MRCLTVLVQCLGEQSRQCQRSKMITHMNFLRSSDKLNLMASESLPRLLSQGLSRTMFKLVNVINKYFPPLRSCTQLCVYEQVVIVLRDCRWTLFAGLGPLDAHTVCISHRREAMTTRCPYIAGDSNRRCSLLNTFLLRCHALHHVKVAVCIWDIILA